MSSCLLNPGTQPTLAQHRVTQHREQRLDGLLTGGHVGIWPTLILPCDLCSQLRSPFSFVPDGAGEQGTQTAKLFAICCLQTSSEKQEGKDSVTGSLAGLLGHTAVSHMAKLRLWGHDHAKSLNQW